MRVAGLVKIKWIRQDSLYDFYVGTTLFPVIENLNFSWFYLFLKKSNACYSEWDFLSESFIYSKSYFTLKEGTFEEGVSAQSLSPYYLLMISTWLWQRVFISFIILLVMAQTFWSSLYSKYSGQWMKTPHIAFLGHSPSYG